MKKLLAPFFSQGILVFAVILFLLNLLAFRYIEGFKSWWLMLVIEFTGVIAYAISRLGEADTNIWGIFKQENDE